MNDLERQVGAAREVLRVELSAADTAQALLRFEDHRRRRQRRRVAGGAALTLAVAAAALGLWLRPTPEAPTGRIVDPPPLVAVDEPAAPVEAYETDHDHPSRKVFFSDGSSAELVQAKTQLRLEASSEDLLELSLASGEARFEVQKNPRRLFRVRTSDLRVEVLGTRFAVAEDPEDGVERVSVYEGRVAVFVGTERHELGPRMRLTYDGERTVVEDDAERPRPERRRSKRRRPRRERTAAPMHITVAWQDLAEDGRFGDAYEAMQEAPERPVGTAELMLAADVARLSGHPREAVGYLEQVVERRDDPRALPAAFTLGRILQRELGAPKRAAEAFHVAWSLAPTGSLAEDALAHEAECWSRAGQDDKARARAQDYLRQYPNGRKATAMRRLTP
ncbi:MAG: FecR domain-containing protein [Deltaproteobacteria bacterium]|nr:FecR domain-containing protein [Deltaproteobacteria bacterium]